MTLDHVCTVYDISIVHHESHERGVLVSERRRTMSSAVGDPVPFDRRRHSGGDLEWLDVGAAVRYLALPSRKALYQAVRRGQIPMHRLGKRRMRFRRAELDQVLERGRQASALDCG